MTGGERRWTLWLVTLVVGAAMIVPYSTSLVAQEQERLVVDDYGTGTEVVDRELVDRRTTFSEGERVVFWTRVVGGSSGDRIQHVWLRDGEEMLTVGLAVNAPHWRTWSFKTLHGGSAGSWVVEARDEAGEVLARSEFSCTAPDSDD